MAVARHRMGQIIRSLERQGCTVTQSRRGYRVKCPDGSVFTLHTTPQNRDDQVNLLRQQFRRHGLTWDPDIRK